MSVAVEAPIERDHSKIFVAGERKRVLFYASFKDGFTGWSLTPARRVAINSLVGDGLIVDRFYPRDGRRPPRIGWVITPAGRIVLAQSKRLQDV